MIARLYGGPMHGEVLEVQDGHDSITYQKPKVSWPKNPSPAEVWVDTAQYVADYPKTQNEDGETLFRFKN